MSLSRRGGWRSLRYLLFVLCAGGLLAADNTWITSIDSSILNPSRWFWSASVNDSAVLPAAVNVPVDLGPGPRLSMDGLINGLLFERPAGRWILDSRATGSHSSLARRLVEFDQVNQISGADNFAAYQMPASFARTHVAPAAVTAEAPAAPSAPTADGTWRANASGNWSDSTKWGSGVVADGAGNSAFFNTLDITTNVTVTLDTSRTIGSLLIADLNATHKYTISSSGGSTLTFDNAGSNSSLEQMGGSAGDTISAPILVNNDLDINNFSATNQFTISGNIASSATSGFGQILWFNPSGSGKILVSGNISNGSTGQSISVVVNAGTVTLTGTNSYTGFTEVSGGTLLVNGNNTAATGSVYVYGSGTLGGTGTIGGDVNLYGGTITGDTSTTVGTLTLLGNANFANVEGGGGTYLANLSGNLSDLLAITGNMVLGSDTTLSIVGAADGVTTYTLATFASHINEFEFVNGLPSGYTLVYHDMDLQLVPIPEPATWIGGALVLGALVFTQRRRFRRA